MRICEDTFTHWADVQARISAGVLSVTDDLTIVEAQGYTSETRYLQAKHASTAVALPCLLNGLVERIGLRAVQVNTRTPCWAVLLKRRGVDIIAIGDPALTRPGDFTVHKGDQRSAGMFPDRTLFLVDVKQPSVIRATFRRCRSPRIVYIGRPLSEADTGPQWVLSERYRAYGHARTEVQIYDRA